MASLLETDFTTGISRPLMQGNEQFVTFNCGESAYGLPIMAVREIRSWQQTTPLPGRPESSCGALNIRGAVVEVLDLSVLLGREKIAAGAASVVLVIAQGERAIGVLVDSVSDIIQAGGADLMPVPTRTEGAWGARITSMIESDGRLVGVIDLDSLFDGAA